MLSVFFFKQKTAYEMRISDWSSDVCSSDLRTHDARRGKGRAAARDHDDTADPVHPADAVRRHPRPSGLLDQGRAAHALICEAAPARSPTPPPVQYTAVGRWGGGEGRCGNRFNYADSAKNTPWERETRQDRKSTRLNSSH